MMTRHVQTTVAIAVTFLVASAAAAQDIPPEMKVLEQRLGAWETKSTAKPAVWTPDGFTYNTFEKIDLVLKGHFVQAKAVNQTDKSEATWLATYDVNKKVYRFWYHNSFGHSMESSGPMGREDENPPLVRYQFRRYHLDCSLACHRCQYARMGHGRQGQGRQSVSRHGG